MAVCVHQSALLRRRCRPIRLSSASVGGVCLHCTIVNVSRVGGFSSLHFQLFALLLMIAGFLKQFAVYPVSAQEQVVFSVGPSCSPGLPLCLCQLVSSSGGGVGRWIQFAPRLLRRVRRVRQGRLHCCLKDLHSDNCMCAVQCLGIH